jgi:hypothetical protein
VPGSLCGDLPPLIRGKLHGRHDILRRFGKHHRCRLLVGREVERLARFAVSRVSRQDDIPLELPDIKLACCEND